MKKIFVSAIVLSLLWAVYQNVAGGFQEPDQPVDCSCPQWDDGEKEGDPSIHIWTVLQCGVGLFPREYPANNLPEPAECCDPAPCLNKCPDGCDNISSLVAGKSVLIKRGEKQVASQKLVVETQKPEAPSEDPAATKRKLRIGDANSNSKTTKNRYLQKTWKIRFISATEGPVYAKVELHKVPGREVTYPNGKKKTFDDSLQASGVEIKAPPGGNVDFVISQSANVRATSSDSYLVKIGTLTAEILTDGS